MYLLYVIVTLSHYSYQLARDEKDAQIMSSISKFADSVFKDNSLDVDGSLYQTHANVAAIRPDLPPILPTVRLLIGVLSSPKNIDRRTEVCYSHY